MARATWNGETIAESNEHQVVEGNLYFPPDAVNWEYLKEGDKQYTCPWKGKARYYDIMVNEKLSKNAAWSYLEPKEAAKHIKGHVAFERAVEVEP